MKRFLTLFLCAALCLTCFAGCRATPPAETPTTAPAAQNDSGNQPQNNPNPEVNPLANLNLEDAKNLGFSVFDNQLIEFLKQSGLGDQNFTVSPLSFKAALALAALGAEGETLDQILAALGYTDLAQLEAWYQTVLDGVEGFDAFFDSERISDRGDAAYQVVNAVWRNEDLPGEFRDAYTAEVKEKLCAEVRSAAAARLAQEINAWVNEKTNGLIPQLLEDAHDASAVLVNALYLKAGWETPFAKLGEDDFTTLSGETVQKEYLRVIEKFGYYEDEATQLVVVPLQGGMNMLFVLGDDSDLAAKLDRATFERVEVTVPMFDVETTLNQKELCQYLVAVGCDKMFSDFAEFDPMYTDALRVDDIIQKAKVHIDEEGLEAAAATAMLMVRATAIQPEPPEPKIFRADRPFSFYIVNNNDAPELLFWGQIVS